MPAFKSPYCTITEGCTNYALTHMDGCESCEHAKRKEVKLSLKPKKENKAIKVRSEKEAERMKRYVPEMLKFLEANPDCQMKLSMCTGKATTNQHLRGRIGDLLFDQRYWMSACVSCHQFVNEHPEFALKHGFALERLNINDQTI